MGKNGSNDQESSGVLQQGKSAANNVSRLPFAEKINHLRALEHKERLDRIIADPEAKRILKAFDPPELYWMVKHIGENDVSELLELCAPEQIEFFLDMECWEKGVFSEEKFITWLGHLLDIGDKRIIELLPHLELEFLVLALMKEIVVGGGVGDMVAEAEKEHEWDHSFDGCYMISFKNSSNANIIGKFIDIIYSNFQPLYLVLMESIRTETLGEIEELSFQFRSARLADWGFPELEDALTIYAHLDPRTYTPSGDKVISTMDGGIAANLPLPISGESLLQRAILVAGQDALLQELNYLINNAIVAEGLSLADRDDMRSILQRVYGYLNIALEFICNNDEVRAGALLEQEHLKRLFQLGRGFIVPLRKNAEKLQSSGKDFGYAANKVLLGLKAVHPKFYRGLDADTIDGYREFNSKADVAVMTAFLDSINEGSQGNGPG
jgi:hypothetical protein